MQQPKMIVLALLGMGMRYGFEMEDFARRTDMRRWAKIGMSTIYKTLKVLESEGAVTVQTEGSDIGPSRKAYALTENGRARMVTLIGEALASDTPVFSERIAGLVFVELMGAKGTEAIIAATERLERADALLADSLGIDGTNTIGTAVLEYYRAVYAAEREAMRKVLATIR